MLKIREPLRQNILKDIHASRNSNCKQLRYPLTMILHCHMPNKRPNKNPHKDDYSLLHGSVTSYSILSGVGMNNPRIHWLMEYGSPIHTRSHALHHHTKVTLRQNDKIKHS